MQTVQFKVLNTDTQETNVQMQTENKAQNTQNTEVSGVESTGESAGTKKKTTVSTGQTGVTDAESAKWVAGLQLKKCAYEQVSAITEKIKDMLDPTSGMTDAQKSSYDRKVMNKVYSGKKLSAEEMRYIKIHYPALYPYVERVQIQRQALEERIKHCHSKEEVQDVYSEAMFHISDDDPAKQMLYAAYDDVLKEFKKTSDYQELPETKEDAEKKKQLKAEGNYEALQLLPKNASRVRLHNRCKITGRPKGYIRQFGISRIQFREMASAGLIPGVKKASW